MIKKIGLILFLICSLIIGFISVVSVYSSNTSFKTDDIQILIPSNSNKKDVLLILSPHLKNETSFKLVAELKGYFENIRFGVFTLKRGMNNNELVNKLRLNSEGVNVTFNNANSLEELAFIISDQIEADSLSLIKSFKEVNFLKENSFTMDNALSMYIPNTYNLYWNSSAQDFRDRMLKEYKLFWNSYRRKKAENIGLTPTQVYTLASIVNKESNMVDERPRIAGVYLNLLSIGERLRSDPTVIYALKKESNNPDLLIKRVLYKDLKIDSPYNTYKYEGVPPGPICMPDMSSIISVLNPEKHDYYFFVVDVENFGYHVFASSLEEHNRNKKKYVQWINNQGIFR